MKVAATIGSIILVLVLLVTLAFVMELGGLQWDRFFKPKHAAVEREVFKETKSYNEAKLQDLAKYRLEYMKSDSDQDKEAIASTVRVMFADYDSSSLPDELESFLKQVRGY